MNEAGPYLVHSIATTADTEHRGDHGEHWRGHGELEERPENSG